METNKNYSKNDLLHIDDNVSNIQTSKQNQITTKYTKTVQEYLKNLSENQKNDLIKKFEQEKITSPILQDLYKKK